NRRHQRDETQVGLNHRKQCTDPSAIAGGEHTEFAGTALAQCVHQLPQFGHSLAQRFCVADEIAGDRKFAVPKALRDTRIRVWQMNETYAPAKSVKPLCATSIANPTRRQQCVQNKKRGCPSTALRPKHIYSRDIVRRELGLNRAAPCDSRVTVS